MLLRFRFLRQPSGLSHNHQLDHRGAHVGVEGAVAAADDVEYVRSVCVIVCPYWLDNPGRYSPRFGRGDSIRTGNDSRDSLAVIGSGGVTV